ncbi:MAG: TatD family hydrolase [Bacteroidales bacterium]|jgi:TatD DNase family protein|nr:TatD family hydrolase [Bacteroidales bacterium]
MIDTHTHIYLSEFDEDRHEAVQRAKTENVSAIILPNIDKHSIAAMNQTANQFPDIIYMMMGLHPTSIDADFESHLEIIKHELDSGKYIAVGEIGMDLYWDKQFAEHQKIAFIQQCNWAVEKKLPVSIHLRSAHNEVVRALKGMPEMPKGVFHCFGGSVQEALEVINMGFYLGIGGIVTFKNTNLRNVLKHIDPKHIVLETDAPYLAPHPFRGKRNEPAYLKLVLETLAEIYQLPILDLDELISENARKLYGI